MTAVNWLLQELEKINYHPTEAMIMYAKKLEKQQIIDAGNSCAMKSHLYRDKIDKMTEDELNKHLENDVSTTFGEQYYNETYGSKGSEKKEYPHSHIYETMNGRYGLSSYDEHDQTDGIFDTYQEAVDFGLSLINNPTSSQVDRIMGLAEKSRNSINDVAHLCSGEVEEHIFDIGFYQGYITKTQTEISDEEIEEASAKLYTTPHGSWGFVQGVKWYREQLKKKQ